MHLFSKLFIPIMGATFYGVIDINPSNNPSNAPEGIDKRVIIVTIGTFIIGIIWGIDLLITKKIKKRRNNNVDKNRKDDNINRYQVLYGPPRAFRNKTKIEPPEDLYGCPRPEEMNIESSEQEDEKDK